MAASFHLQVPLLHKSHFLGQTSFTNSTQRSSPTLPKTPSKNVTPTMPSSSSAAEEEEKKADLNASDDAFEKELLGLTGGFPGGENGLKRFIEKNLPPKKKESSASEET